MEEQIRVDVGERKRQRDEFAKLHSEIDVEVRPQQLENEMDVGFHPFAIE